MYLPVPGFEPMSSEFLDKCATRWATVADSDLDQMYSFLFMDMGKQRDKHTDLQI